MPHRAKILVCDDDKSIVLLLSRRLKVNNYDVVTAKDGKEALEKTKKEKPDLIIMDLNMPEKNGYQVCREIRNDPDLKGIPIILLSAWVRDKMGDDINLADVYLTKPFTPEQLLGEINYLLSPEAEEKPEAP